MRAIITAGTSGADLVTVHWNDLGQRCEIRSGEFGQVALSEAGLRNLYQALNFLLGRDHE